MNLWVALYRFAWSVLAMLGIVLVLALFYPKVRQLTELQEHKAKMSEEVRLQNELLAHLKKKEEMLLSDPRFVEKIAREELGLAKPGETVFKFTDTTQSNKTAKGTR